MMFRSHLLAGVLALGAFAAAGPAAAACVNGLPTVVGDACYVLQVPGASKSDDKPTSLTNGPGGANVYAYAEGNEENGGTVIAQISTQGDDVSARSSLNWMIAPDLVPGAQPDDLVPLRMIAKAYWSFTGDPGGPSAAIFLSQAGRTLFGGNFNGFVTRETIFDIDEVIWVRSDAPITVSLQAIAFGRQGFTSQATVTADPTFEIVGDYASRYTLKGLLGQAAPPSGAVPEPATWALMIGGFGLAGAALRRRRAAFA